MTMPSRKGLEKKGKPAHQKVWCGGKKQAKILVVDDDEDFRHILSDVLHDEGHNVITAQDAHEAIKRVRENGFTIIFMDIVLPDMNGVETYKVIKKMSPATVTVMMTGYSVEDLVKEAINEGAYNCLHKPFGMDEILNVVKKITG